MFFYLPYYCSIVVFVIVRLNRYDYMPLIYCFIYIYMIGRIYQHLYLSVSIRSISFNVFFKTWCWAWSLTDRSSSSESQVAARLGQKGLPWSSYLKGFKPNEVLNVGCGSGKPEGCVCVCCEMFAYILKTLMLKWRLQLPSCYVLYHTSHISPQPRDVPVSFNLVLYRTSLLVHPGPSSSALCTTRCRPMWMITVDLRVPSCSCTGMTVVCMRPFVESVDGLKSTVVADDGSIQLRIPWFARWF